ncbi:hypothetical protein AAC387_Pa07g0139 [Persea americana]
MASGRGDSQQHQQKMDYVFKIVLIDTQRSQVHTTVGAMVVYDITKRQTFDHIPRWLDELRAHADKNIVIIMIGNKIDLEDERAVPTEDAKEFTEKEGLFFLETSALEATTVKNAFMAVLTEIFNIVNRKNLVADEAKSDINVQSLSGKKIVVQGPAQEIPAKSSMCCSF